MKKIIISRVGGIGDVVMTTAIVLALKEKYPKSKLIYIVKKNAEQALERIEAIDEVLVYDKSFKNSLEIIKKIWCADLFFLVDTTYRLAVLGALAFAKKRVGLAHKRKFWLTESVNWEKWMDYRYDPELSAYILFKTTGIQVNTTNVWNKLTFSDANETECSLVRKKFAAQKIKIEEPYIVFSLYTAAKAKDWPEEKWVELWKRLEKKYPNIPIILLGDRKSNFEFTANVKDFSGATSLIETGYIIKKSILVINSCSLPMHIARAFKVPTIGLYGPNPVEKGAPPENFFSHVTSAKCAPCEGYYSGACEQPYCMELISVEEVELKLLEFLEVVLKTAVVSRDNNCKN